MIGGEEKGRWGVKGERRLGARDRDRVQGKGDGCNLRLQPESYLSVLKIQKHVIPTLKTNVLDQRERPVPPHSPKPHFFSGIQRLSSNNAGKTRLDQTSVKHFSKIYMRNSSYITKQQYKRKKEINKQHYINGSFIVLND